VIAVLRWAARVAFLASLLTLAAVPAWWVASRPPPVDAGALPGSTAALHATPPAVTTTTSGRTTTAGPTTAGPTTAAPTTAAPTTTAPTPAAAAETGADGTTSPHPVTPEKPAATAPPTTGEARPRHTQPEQPAPADDVDDGSIEAVPDKSPPPTTLATRSGRLGDLPAPEPRPIRVLVEQLGVSAPVFHIGVDEHGALNVPHDVHHVGWYRGGARPGQPGSAVLAAHVDSYSQGVGAFYGIADLTLGSRVLVEDDRGGHQWWGVEARRAYSKHELPIDTLFRRDGDPVLTIVTCGGEFDPVTRSYDSNVVVYATPLTDRVDGPPVPPA